MAQSIVFRPYPQDPSQAYGSEWQERYRPAPGEAWPQIITEADVPGLRAENARVRPARRRRDTLMLIAFALAVLFVFVLIFMMLGSFMNDLMA